jgi:hypothetical protein
VIKPDLKGSNFGRTWFKHPHINFKMSEQGWRFCPKGRTGQD